MEHRIYHPADKVITIRISQSEYNHLQEILTKENFNRPLHKLKNSELVRRMIIYCLNNNIYV